MSLAYVMSRKIGVSGVQWERQKVALDDTGKEVKSQITYGLETT